MNVEDCCQSILSKLLPIVDPEKHGLTIDIGVGTFAFYCELFEKLGFHTVAVEPLPTKELLNLCCYRNIKLIQTCISDVRGDVNIFVGQFDGQENLNLSSLRQDWWGGSTRKITVPSRKLEDLMKELNPSDITCIKIDVEGVEFSIIQQLSDVRQDLLPKILMFEYGGGNDKESGKGGWKKEIFESTINAINLLKKMNYKQVIMIESAEENIRVFDLKDINLSSEIFSNSDIYGNIIAIQDNSVEKNHISLICRDYSKGFKFSSAEIKESLAKKTVVNLRKLKCRFYRYN